MQVAVREETGERGPGIVKLGSQRVPFALKPLCHFRFGPFAGTISGFQLLLFCKQPLAEGVNFALQGGFHTGTRQGCLAVNENANLFAAQFGVGICRLQHFPRGTQIIAGDKIPQTQFIFADVRKPGIRILYPFDFGRIDLRMVTDADNHSDMGFAGKDDLHPLSYTEFLLRAVPRSPLQFQWQQNLNIDYLSHPCKYTQKYCTPTSPLHTSPGPISQNERK